MKKIKHVLFDIDGTMTDSAPGIIRAYTVVAQKLKVMPPPVDVLRDFIGCPLRSSLESYIPKGKIEEAVRYYYYCYDYMRIGLTQNGVYDGVLAALGQVQESGKQLYVVTAKLSDFTLPILNLFELERYFKAVYAPHTCEATEIGDQIKLAIETEGLNPDATIMVGDRCYDMRGAQANNIDFIGVSWGYGSRQELQDAGVKYIVDTPAELVKLLAS
ncbi:MAG: HAD hydrolase-like protein [Alphaproteobacteria bacterium]|nr:HAD hydrolase-like protein [Alphaproteobacteria bacterium]